MLDLIIIGASAAGTTAAIYSARRRLNFKVIAKDLGGEVALSGVIRTFHAAWMGGLVFVFIWSGIKFLSKNNKPGLT
jgi:ribulose 1,5-bisphosphate synthetase/thiazole synthase